VFGASGFVGSALCERLFFDKEHDFVAYIHTYGAAARIGRFPIDIRSINVLDYNQVRQALNGCSTIVNCSRGDELVLLNGLRNIIRAAKKNNIQKFIHIGSVAIYGDDPQPQSTCEAAVPDPGSNRYGVQKLKQDQMIFRLNRCGMPAVILCPSNIYGPYSPFVLQAVSKLRAQEVVLVDDGRLSYESCPHRQLASSHLNRGSQRQGIGREIFC